jgi:membrane protease YdiL (CAAX protease family)
MSNQRNPPSPLWIVLYVTLHLLWQQLLPGGAYAILPFSFAGLFIFMRARGHLPGSVEHLVGRWLPERSDLPVAIAFILATLVLRVLVGRCFGLTPYPKQLAVIAELSVWAPLSEELICRGLFLGILLARLPGQPLAAVVWSAAIFLGLHSYAGSNVPAVAAVLSLGLLCGATYATTRCVPLCIVCHALFNTLGWWTDVPRAMSLTEVLWGAVLFVCGAAVIGWLLKVFIKRQRYTSTAQRSGGANGSLPVDAEPNRTPSAAGSGG